MSVVSHEHIEETTCMPDAARVMEGLRDTGYDFNTAVADIVDNSIAADATKINISIAVSPAMEVSVFVADNGCGMDQEELQNAMRYGSSRRENPSSLGKFGLGLKTASTAFCRCLSVVSRDTGADEEEVVKAQWDLDYIIEKNQWLLRWPEVTDDELDLLDAVACGSHGTLVCWERVDRLLRQYTYQSSARNALKKIEASLRFHLATTYQRFLDPEITDVRDVTITLNNVPVEAWDPFCTIIDGTEVLLDLSQDIDLPDGTKAPLTLIAYLLPSKNELKSEKDRKAAKISNDLQGFYVYRENRLIHYGDWMGMFTKEPHGSLLRIFLSFDHKLDDYLNVDIKKSRILMDDGLFNSLKDAISAPRRAADERYRNGVTKKVIVGGKDAHEQSNTNIETKAKSVEGAKIKVTDAASNQVEVTNANGTFKHTISIRTASKPGQYRVIPVPSIDDGMLWNPCIVDQKHAVEINQSHPYYQKIYYPVLDQSNMVTGMDALLWALAEAELSTFNDDTKEQYEDMRIQVSRYLKKLIADLPEPEETEE